MAKRKGRTVFLDTTVHITGNAGVAGRLEGEGPLGGCFDRIYEDTTMGEDSWEKAESSILLSAVKLAMEKSGNSESDVDAIFSGDLLGQCIGSVFAFNGIDIPFCGMYGACSTMALTAINACLTIESGAAQRCIAATSSHFCSAEKQFRFPLEYGGQRTPTSQRTVTGAGAMILERTSSPLSPMITACHLGTITDLGITDSTNMGAAMAPAARRTISNFFRDTNTLPSDYDLILTGDLGKVGSELLYELLEREDNIDIRGVHSDCGLMIFDCEKQDVHAGGSGCGCSASVLCSYVLTQMRQGKYRNVLFIATGALMSPVSAREGNTIPSIAHLINIKM